MGPVQASARPIVDGRGSEQGTGPLIATPRTGIAGLENGMSMLSFDGGRRWALWGLLLLSACGGGRGPAADTADFQARSAPVEVDGAVVRMQLPQPLFLIGYEEDLTADLSTALRPLSQSVSSGLAPTTVFEIYRPNAQWQAAFDAFLQEAKHPGHAEQTGFSGEVLDGNAIEAYLASHLPEVAAIPPGLNSLVVLDPGLRGHAYHYSGNVGWREPVRTFGEASPLLIWDPQAAVDPWVGTAEPHHNPVDAPSAELIADWAHRATSIRTVQEPIWPPTTLSCHAVTVVLAVRNTSLTPALFGLQSWEETLDIPLLEASFTALMQDPVSVDLVVVQLPLEDPVLDLLTRENNLRVPTATYLDLNFDSYHVAHEGCEPYLSLVVFGDLLDQRTSSNGNAQTSLINGRRISTSLVAENVRLMSEVVGYNELWDESTSFERVGPGADPLEWFNWVVAHETGHLFSLPHPNAGAAEGGSYSDTAFASTWSAMGYQMRRIVTEMSVIDANNVARNQAAYALLETEPGPQRQAALEAMGAYRWKEALRVATGVD